jgi:uncharacterized membrane protein
MLASFMQDLRQPEYLHVLINPLPVYGLAMGVIAVVIALLQRSPRAQITGLTIIILTASIAWPVAHYGEEAYDRVLAMSDDTGQAWLKVHAHRVDQFIWFFYALAVLAAAAIFTPLQWPRSRTALTIVTLLLGFVVLGMGCYIAYAGGKIRHREFRNEPPPPPPVEQEG